jgi:methionyl-tRNA formyltransferase
MTEPKPSLPKTPLRVVFAGTPDFAASVLAALLESQQAGPTHQIVACYTQPDRPAGRGRKLTPSPVKALALAHDIPVLQPLNFKAQEDVDALAALQPDLMIVVAYGLILPQRVLDIPTLGCINVHASLLPRWRGAAPIQRSLIEGDAETGITLMQMEAGLDTGPMLVKVATPIAADETGGQLHDRLAVLGARAMADLVIQMAETGLPPADVQDNALATYAHKLSKEEGQLDWTQPATILARKIRGLNPWPVAYSQIQGETVRVWNATPSISGSGDGHSGRVLPGTILTADKNGIALQTGDGVLVLTELQLPGGKALPARDILNSRAAWFAPGECFGADKSALARDASQGEPT